VGLQQTKERLFFHREQKMFLKFKIVLEKSLKKTDRFEVIQGL
jgi:hypothetical protein